MISVRGSNPFAENGNLAAMSVNLDGGNAAVSSGLKDGGTKKPGEGDVPADHFKVLLDNKSFVPNLSTDTYGLFGYVSERELSEWKFLETLDLDPETDLPRGYSTASGLRKPLLRSNPTQSLQDILEVKIDFPPIETFLRSRSHNGSFGCVRLGFYNNRPVALKSYFSKAMSASTVDTTLLESYAAAQILDDLGLGPQVHGVYKDETGKFWMVTDIIPGDRPAEAGKCITVETIRELFEIDKRLRDAHVTVSDFQYFVTPGGHVFVFDPQIERMEGAGGIARLQKELELLLGAAPEHVFLDSQQYLAENQPEMYGKLFVRDGGIAAESGEGRIVTAEGRAQIEGGGRYKTRSGIEVKITADEVRDLPITEARIKEEIQRLQEFPGGASYGFDNHVSPRWDQREWLKRDMENVIIEKARLGEKTLLIYELGLGNHMREPEQIISLLDEVLSGLKKDRRMDFTDWHIEIVGIDNRDLAQEVEEKERVLKKPHMRFRYEQGSTFNAARLEEISRGKKGDYVIDRYGDYVNRYAIQGRFDLKTIGFRGGFVKYMISCYLSVRNLLEAFAKEGTVFIVEPVSDIRDTDFYNQPVFLMPGAELLDANGLGNTELPEMSLANRGTGMLRIKDPRAFRRAGVKKWLELMGNSGGNKQDALIRQVIDKLRPQLADIRYAERLLKKARVDFDLPPKGDLAIRHFIGKAKPGTVFLYLSTIDIEDGDLPVEAESNVLIWDQPAVEKLKKTRPYSLSEVPLIKEMIFPDVDVFLVSKYRNGSRIVAKLVFFPDGKPALLRADYMRRYTFDMVKAGIIDMPIEDCLSAKAAHELGGMAPVYGLFPEFSTGNLSLVTGIINGDFAPVAGEFITENTIVDFIGFKRKLEAASLFMDYELQPLIDRQGRVRFIDGSVVPEALTPPVPQKSIFLNNIEELFLAMKNLVVISKSLEYFQEAYPELAPALVDSLKQKDGYVANVALQEAVRQVERPQGGVVSPAPRDGGNESTALPQAAGITHGFDLETARDFNEFMKARMEFRIDEVPDIFHTEDMEDWAVADFDNVQQYVSDIFEDNLRVWLEDGKGLVSGIWRHSLDQAGFQYEDGTIWYYFSPHGISPDRIKVAESDQGDLKWELSEHDALRLLVSLRDSAISVDQAAEITADVVIELTKEIHKKGFNQVVMSGGSTLVMYKLLTAAQDALSLPLLNIYTLSASENVSSPGFINPSTVEAFENLKSHTPEAVVYVDTHWHTGFKRSILGLYFDMQYAVLTSSEEARSAFERDTMISTDPKIYVFIERLATEVSKAVKSVPEFIDKRVDYENAGQFESLLNRREKDYLEKIINNIYSNSERKRLAGLQDGGTTGKTMEADRHKIIENVPPVPKNKFAGIDFRNLPIVSQSIPVIPPNLQVPIQPKIPLEELEKEWGNIQKMVNNGNIPSGNKIREYVLSCCQKGDITADLEKVLACISQILRLEEDYAVACESGFIEFLSVLESNKSPQELQLSLSLIRF